MGLGLKTRGLRKVIQDGQLKRGNMGLGLAIVFYPLGIRIRCRWVVYLGLSLWGNKLGKNLKRPNPCGKSSQGDLGPSSSESLVPSPEKASSTAIC